MRQKFTKKVVALAMTLLILTPVLVFSTPVFATDANSLLWGGQESAVQTQIGLGNRDPRVMVASIINIVLSFLGIIAVIIVILGGFKWMTGGGNEDKISEAKKLIVAGVIGLVIILASWSIATFVINNLVNVTNA